MSETLKPLRKKIENINQQILELLNERTTIVMQIKKKKQEENIPLFDLERENAMLEKVITTNKGPIPLEMATKIFKEIFKTSLSYMKETKIM